MSKYFRKWPLLCVRVHASLCISVSQSAFSPTSLLLFYSSTLSCLVRISSLWFAPSLTVHFVRALRERKTLECAKGELHVHQMAALAGDDSKLEPPSPGHDTRRGRLWMPRREKRDTEHVYWEMISIAAGWIEIYVPWMLWRCHVLLFFFLKGACLLLIYDSPLFVLVFFRPYSSLSLSLSFSLSLSLSSHSGKNCNSPALNHFPKMTRIEPN